MSHETWRKLKVGDCVRLVRMPSGIDAPGYTFHPETRRLYKRLIARNRPVRVFEIDDWGLPWISCRFRRKNGGWEYHALCIDDDSWVLVRSRKRNDGLARNAGATGRRLPAKPTTDN